MCTSMWMWLILLWVWFLCPQVVLALGDYMSVQCHACIGGTNVGEDIRKLDYGQHVVSGTPGRVFGEHVIETRVDTSQPAPPPFLPIA